MNDSPREPRRIASYAAALGVFTLTSAVVTATGKSRGRLADRYQVLDVALGALATQKFSRMLAKDPVTTPIRAPFTEYEGVSGDAELAESPREDRHATHTIGELIACPFCLAPWVAGGYVTGLTFAPRVARAWAAVFAMVGASDAMQHAYARLQTD
jgi:hypothetical protein